MAIPTPKQYEEALKEVNKTSPPEAMVTISLGWSKMILLPHSQALQFLGSLKNAEVIEGYGDEKRITPIGFEDDLFKMSPIAKKEIDYIRIANLLGIKPNEASMAEKEAAKAKHLSQPNPQDPNPS